MTSPYAPFPATRPPQAFPRTRLRRAGLDEDAVARVESEYLALDEQQRVEFGRYVSAHSDDAIRERFTEGVRGVEPPEEPAEVVVVTYEELNALTVDELDDRLRAWNEGHPEQHLTIAGRKGEKIGRLLDAYEGEREALLAVEPVQLSEPVQVATSGTEQPTGGTVAAEQVLPTAPTATTPEGAPEAASAASGGVADGPTLGGPLTGSQEPAQTVVAEPGAGVAPSTSTEE